VGRSVNTETFLTWTAPDGPLVARVREYYRGLRGQMRICLVDKVGRVHHFDVDEVVESYAEPESLDVSRMISFLPRWARERLAEGPKREPLCGVCKVLNKRFFDSSGPAAALIDWHSTSAITDEDSYIRCLAIYAAAAESLA
jgi:hypothetical protein